MNISWWIWNTTWQPNWSLLTEKIIVAREFDEKSIWVSGRTLNNRGRKFKNKIFPMYSRHIWINTNERILNKRFNIKKQQTQHYIIFTGWYIHNLYIKNITIKKLLTTPSERNRELQNLRGAQLDIHGLLRRYSLQVDWSPNHRMNRYFCEY